MQDDVVDAVGALRDGDGEGALRIEVLAGDQRLPGAGRRAHLVGAEPQEEGPGRRVLDQLLRVGGLVEAVDEALVPEELQEGERGRRREGARPALYFTMFCSTG